MKKVFGFLLSLTLNPTSCESSRDNPIDEFLHPQEKPQEIDDLRDFGKKWMPLACDYDLAVEF
jgi:hypothetical protein